MKIAIGLAFLLVIAAAALMNGTSGGFYLDDLPNLSSVIAYAEAGCSSTHQAWEVITGNASGPLGRPVSMASFVVSACLIDPSPYGFKIFNIGIHLLCGALVFLLARQLTRGTETNQHLTALIAAGLWLSAPLLVSTTLYSVQRMTQLSTLFSLIAMLCYIRGRLVFQASPSRGYAYVFLSMLFIAMGVLAKETALLTPVLIGLIEYSMQRSGISPGRFRTGIIWYHTATWGIPVIAAFIALAAFPERLLNFSQRDFTLGERVMTESRILLDYIQQLIAPQHMRMGVYQDDFPVSESLLHPPSTLFSILTLSLILIGGLFLARSERLRPVGVGILFYFIGHALESTIFPLELYFEHRNYLPSIGLFIAIAYLLTPSVIHKKPYGLVLAAGLITTNLYFTHSLSITWGNDARFAERAISQHSGSERALSEAAELLTTPQNVNAAIAVTELSILKHPEKAASSYLQRILIECRVNKATPGIDSNRLDQYLHDSKNDTYAIRVATEALNMQLVAHSCQGLPAQQLANHLDRWFRKHIGDISPEQHKDTWPLLLAISETLDISGNRNAANELLKTGTIHFPENPILMLTLAENLIASGSPGDAKLPLQQAMRIVNRDSDAPEELRLQISSLLQAASATENK